MTSLSPQETEDVKLLLSDMKLCLIPGLGDCFFEAVRVSLRAQRPPNETVPTVQQMRSKVVDSLKNTLKEIDFLGNGISEKDLETFRNPSVWRSFAPPLANSGIERLEPGDFIPNELGKVLKVHIIINQVVNNESRIILSTGDIRSPTKVFLKQSNETPEDVNLNHYDVYLRKDQSCSPHSETYDKKQLGADGFKVEGQPDVDLPSYVASFFDPSIRLQVCSNVPIDKMNVIYAVYTALKAQNITTYPVPYLYAWLVKLLNLEYKSLGLLERPYNLLTRHEQSRALLKLLSNLFGLHIVVHQYDASRSVQYLKEPFKQGAIRVELFQSINDNLYPLCVTCPVFNDQEAHALSNQLNKVTKSPLLLKQGVNDLTHHQNILELCDKSKGHMKRVLQRYFNCMSSEINEEDICALYKIYETESNRLNGSAIPYDVDVLQDPKKVQLFNQLKLELSQKSKNKSITKEEIKRIQKELIALQRDLFFRSSLTYLDYVREQQETCKEISEDQLNGKEPTYVKVFYDKTCNPVKDNQRTQKNIYCFIQNLLSLSTNYAYANPKNTKAHGIPLIEQGLKEYVNLEFFREGTYSKSYKMIYKKFKIADCRQPPVQAPTNPTIAIIKFSKDDQGSELLHETAIGYALNQLNLGAWFMYTYGCFFCHTQSDGSNSIGCKPYGEKSYKSKNFKALNILGYVKGLYTPNIEYPRYKEAFPGNFYGDAQRLLRPLQPNVALKVQDYQNFFVKSIEDVFFQLAAALFYAQQSYKFVHYDLHSENVQVQYLSKKDNNLKFSIGASTIELANVLYLPTVIDFGLAVAQVSLPHLDKPLTLFNNFYSTESTQNIIVCGNGLFTNPQDPNESFFLPLLDLYKYVLSTLRMLCYHARVQAKHGGVVNNKPSVQLEGFVKAIFVLKKRWMSYWTALKASGQIANYLNPTTPAEIMHQRLATFVDRSHDEYNSNRSILDNIDVLYEWGVTLTDASSNSLGNTDVKDLGLISGMLRNDAKRGGWFYPYQDVGIDKWIQNVLANH